MPLFRLLPLLLILLLSACQKEDPPPSPNPVDFTAPAVEDLVMYEINLRAFSEEGDFQGVIDRLDTLQILWLMPIHPVGQINSVGQLGSPYSVADYLDVNPEFGSINEFRQLVRAAHDRGIAVIIDWVANHTAWDNPWIGNKDWYTQDANGNIIHPPGTNWMDVADLNFDNPDMRLAMIDAMRYWSDEIRIDGFRCDAADFVPFDFWQQAIDSLEVSAGRELILLAEGSRWDHFTAGFQMNYAWDFYGKLKSVFAGNFMANSIFATHQAETGNLPAGKHKLRFTTNHDETAWDAPPTELFGGEQGSLAASVIAMYLGGVPLLYNGQEVGLDVNLPFFSRYPIDWTLNPWMAAEYRRLIQYYRNSDALKKGDWTAFSDQKVAVFQRAFESDTVLVAVNVRDETVEWIVPAELQDGFWKDPFTGNSMSLSSLESLESYAYLILEKE